jgi:hypothetical protein
MSDPIRCENCDWPEPKLIRAIADLDKARALLARALAYIRQSTAGFAPTDWDSLEERAEVKAILAGGAPGAARECLCPSEGPHADYCENARAPAPPAPEHCRRLSCDHGESEHAEPPAPVFRTKCNFPECPCHTEPPAQGSPYFTATSKVSGSSNAEPPAPRYGPHKFPCGKAGCQHCEPPAFRDAFGDDPPYHPYDPERCQTKGPWCTEPPTPRCRCERDFPDAAGHFPDCPARCTCGETGASFPAGFHSPGCPARR